MLFSWIAISEQWFDQKKTISEQWHMMFIDQRGFIVCCADSSHHQSVDLLAHYLKPASRASDNDEKHSAPQCLSQCVGTFMYV